MDNDNTNETQNDSLGVALAKDFASSAASTAGIWTGMILVGIALKSVQVFKDRHKTTDTANTDED